MLPQQEIAQLAQNVEQLTQLTDELRKQVELLKKANDNQREELMRSHAEFVELKKRYQDLQTAHALTADIADREKARRHLNSLITRIDQTLELLNE